MLWSRWVLGKSDVAEWRSYGAPAGGSTQAIQPRSRPAETTPIPQTSCQKADCSLATPAERYPRQNYWPTKNAHLLQNRMLTNGALRVQDSSLAFHDVPQ